MRGATAILVLAACGHAGTTAATDGAAIADTPPLAVDAAGVYTADPPCAGGDIYAAPAQLPPARGAILACALGDDLDQAATQAALGSSGAGAVTAQTGVRVVKLAYRTVRADGSATFTSATAYLPHTPRRLPAPVVLIGHPTEGIADSCAPSHEARPQSNFALPFAARGYVTISPDLAGLGPPGTHAYLDNHEAAAQLFDGALALRALVPAIGDPAAAVGYSQGGGIVLAAQALELAVTGHHALRAVAAFTPEWPISTRSFGYEDVLRNPDRITALAGLATATVAVLRHYGYFTNKLGLSGAEAFPAAQRSSITNSIESLCTVALGGALDAQQPHLRDLVDDDFRTQMLACIDGTPGCSGLAQSFHAWLGSDFVTADAAGAPVLIAQGLADQVMPAAGEAACAVAKLRSEHVEPAIRTDAIATHESIVERTVGDVAAWVEALDSGAPPPSLGGPALPSCNR